MNFARELLVGTWYRSDTDENGQPFSEYAYLNIDGSFEFAFLRHDEQGEVIEQVVELGDWGLVGDIHFTMTKSENLDGENYAADLNNADNYHAYRVIQLNSQYFEYQHIVTNEVFILRRVVDKIGLC